MAKSFLRNLIEPPNDKQLDIGPIASRWRPVEPSVIYMLIIKTKGTFCQDHRNYPNYHDNNILLNELVDRKMKNRLKKD